MRIGKKIAGILSAGVLCAGVLAGCAADSKEAAADTVKSEVKQSGQETKEIEMEDSGYAFVSKGVEMFVDMDMAQVEEKLGEPSDYYEQPSCAAQGIAKIYTYSGFEIETYPKEEQDLIACIILKDDSVATPEGIDLSMSKDDIVEAYGSDYKESGKSMVYEKNGTKLCFIMDGDDIVSIEYDSPVLN